MTQLNEKPPHFTKTPKTFKLSCTNDFVFKMMFIYDPVKGRRWCKDVAESFGIMLWKRLI